MVKNTPLASSVWQHGSCTSLILDFFKAMHWAIDVLEIKATEVSVSEELPGGKLQVHTNDPGSMCVLISRGCVERSSPRLHRTIGEASQKRGTSHWKLKDVGDKDSGHFRKQEHRDAQGQRWEQGVVIAEVKDEDEEFKKGLKQVRTTPFGALMTYCSPLTGGWLPQGQSPCLYIAGSSEPHLMYALGTSQSTFSGSDSVPAPDKWAPPSSLLLKLLLKVYLTTWVTCLHAVAS